jgi:hypothetical protein
VYEVAILSLWSYNSCDGFAGPPSIHSQVKLTITRHPKVTQAVKERQSSTRESYKMLDR